jgi:hypothetical protein
METEGHIRLPAVKFNVHQQPGSQNPYFYFQARPILELKQELTFITYRQSSTKLLQRMFSDKKIYFANYVLSRIHSLYAVLHEYMNTGF